MAVMTNRSNPKDCILGEAGMVPTGWPAAFKVSRRIHRPALGATAFARQGSNLDPGNRKLTELILLRGNLRKQ